MHLNQLMNMILAKHLEGWVGRGMRFDILPEEQSRAWFSWHVISNCQLSTYVGLY